MGWWLGLPCMRLRMRTSAGLLITKRTIHPPTRFPTASKKQDITIYGIRAELFDDANAARGLDEERHMIKWRGEVCL